MITASPAKTSRQDPTVATQPPMIGPQAAAAPAMPPIAPKAITRSAPS